MMIGMMAAVAVTASQASFGATLPAHQQAEAQALDLAKKAISLRSVAGPGNQTPQVAALFRSALIAGGFPSDDITITPVDETAYIIARWRGADPSLKPLVISGHMDVVEAKPSDWQRDPFTPVVENGFLYGRGATDMKLDGTIALASLIELKREGYVPRRDIIIEFSGDEETAMNTSEIIARKLSNADLVLNIDGGSGTISEETDAPEYFSWQGAEKTYADYELTVTSPGGHSSRPRGNNAINQLAAALVRIGNYRFKPELNEISRAYFKAAARYEPPKTAAAMRAFAADPTNEKAIETLAAEPALAGEIGTTCVTTMVDGGHARNALPQRATANINCRIFPGHNPLDIMAELKRVAADPALTIKYRSAGSVASDASPMRPDLVAALNKAVNAVYPGIPVFPSISVGASDSMWFRHLNVPSYSVSPVFVKESEDFSHGLNERTRLFNIRPSIDYWLVLLPELSR